MPHGYISIKILLTKDHLKFISWNKKLAKANIVTELSVKCSLFYKQITIFKYYFTFKSESECIIPVS